MQKHKIHKLGAPIRSVVFFYNTRFSATPLDPLQNKSISYAPPILQHLQAELDMFYTSSLLSGHTLTPNRFKGFMDSVKQKLENPNKLTYTSTIMR